jgi:hypothetical protein
VVGVSVLDISGAAENKGPSLTVEVSVESERATMNPKLAATVTRIPKRARILPFRFIG